MSETIDRGVLDALDRMLASAIGRPAFKDGARILLTNLDPQGAPQLVRTLLWRDVELPLGILGALPQLANILIGILAELLRQVEGKFSPELLDGFAASLLEDIDKQALAEILTRGQPLVARLAPLIERAWEEVQAQGPEKASAGK